MPDVLNPWGEPPAHRDRRERAAVGALRRTRWKARFWTAAIPVLMMGLVVADVVRDLGQPPGFSTLRDLYLAPSLRVTVRRDPGRGPAIAALRGAIGAAAGAWFYEAIEANHLRRGDTILLSSPGGNLEAALALGRTIRAHGFDTAVGTLVADGAIEPSFCASACVFAFAGGVERRAIQGSRLGVHRFRLVDPGMADAATARRRTLEAIAVYLADMGIEPSLAEAAMATESIRWLDPREARAMQLISKPKWPASQSLRSGLK